MSNLFRSSDEKVIVIEQGDITKLAEDAAKIAIREVKVFLETHPDVEGTSIPRAGSVLLQRRFSPRQLSDRDNGMIGNEIKNQSFGSGVFGLQGRGLVGGGPECAVHLYREDGRGEL
ncbi:MAG: hypothetical protein Q4G65_09965, partial [bacterium]|nr:hypothetical protein [bacterium]